MNWRDFIRALADEIDTLGGPVARDALLRGIGRRMALARGLRTPADIAGLELEINDALAGWGWGQAQLRLDTDDRSLRIVHRGLPAVGSAGDPPGLWLAAILEGLYEGWFGALPGSDHALAVRRRGVGSDGVMLRYARS